MQVIDVHRVLCLEHSRWLALYMEKNSMLHADVKSVFERFFMMMHNSRYGNICENQKRRTEIKLITSEKQCKRLIDKPLHGLQNLRRNAGGCLNEEAQAARQEPLLRPMQCLGVFEAAHVQLPLGLLQE